MSRTASAALRAQSTSPDPSFTYYRLNGDIDGLSGGQVVATVDLRAAIASGLLRRE